MGDHASPELCNVGVIDALLDSPAVPITTKRGLVLVNWFLRSTVTTYFAGELVHVHVHRADCTLANVEFLLHNLFPKNFQLTLVFADQKLVPALNLGEVVGGHWENGNCCFLGTKRKCYTADFFLGHLLVGHCLQHNPVVRLSNGKGVHLASTDDPNIAYRHGTDGGILHATLLRTAECMVSVAKLQESNGGEDFGSLHLTNMGLDKEIVKKIAPQIHDTMKSVPVYELSLNKCPFGPTGAHALFRVGQQWPDLLDLDVCNTDMRNEGCAHLLGAIDAGCMPKIVDLAIANVGLSADGARLLWRTLPKLRNLEHLNVSENRFGSEGMSPLLDSFELEYRMPKLLTLFAKDVACRDLNSTVSKHDSIRADKTLAYTILHGRFPLLNVARVSETWTGTRHAMKILSMRLHAARLQTKLEQWLTQPGDDGTLDDDNAVGD